MEETKELQTMYKIFRCLIYLSLIVEFFEYAIDPALLDYWGGIVCDIHSRVKRWFIYLDGNLVWSKLATIVLICITCIGTRNKKHLEFDARRQVFYPLVGGLFVTILSVWLFGHRMDMRFYTISLNIWLYMAASILGTICIHVALDNISKFLKEGLLKDRFNFENESFEQCQELQENKLSDTHFKVVDYFQKSSDVFPTVDIKGGVAIGLRNANKEFGEIGFFSGYEELRSILKKVKLQKEQNICNLISSRGMYKFTEKMFDDFPQAKDIQGKGSGLQITPNSFEQMPFVFKENGNKEECYQILGRIGSNREYRWIKKEYVQSNDYLDSYNVFVPEANGTGAIGEVLSTPVIGVPVIGHTDTFLSIGKFADAQEASACLKYVKTKFARCLLGTLKATQHNPRDTWANVPLQNFTAISDIDWDQSISDIDKQLYRKYKLDEDEIDFIEEKIKPMD